MFVKGNGTQKVKNLYEKLNGYGNLDYYPFHMPGHKRNEKLGADGLPVSIDITEITGFDNLHHAEGIIKEEQEFAAKLYGADKSYFLVNGSTCGILAAISSVISEEDTLLIARNSHKSVYNAAFLRKAKLQYLQPNIHELGFPMAIEAGQVQKAFDDCPEIKAVVITSPTYEGMIADIESIAEICHAHKALLIVDEAHGAHLAFGEEKEKSAVHAGADIVVQSLHKTLPTLTQTAVLHVPKQENINVALLEQYLSIYQTSSPSYVLMASISKCLHSITLDDFDTYKERLDAFYHECKQFKHIKVFEDLTINQDKGKLIIYDQTGNVTGPELFEKLRDIYHLEFELSMQKYVLGMTSICDETRAFERLFLALAELDATIIPKKQVQQTYRLASLPQKEIELCEALLQETKTVRLVESPGKIVVEYIYIYPPGSPIIVPGECMNEGILGYIKECIQMGMNVQGLSDVTLETVKVLC